jgi:hypothetical protein
MKTQYYWTSGVRLYGKDTFIWSGTGEMITYTNWYTEQPNDLSSNVCIYLEYAYDYQWADFNCDIDKNGLICEQKNNC